MSDILIAYRASSPSSGSSVTIFDTWIDGGGTPNLVYYWIGQDLTNEESGSWNVTSCDLWLSRAMPTGPAISGNITVELHVDAPNGTLAASGTYNRLLIPVGTMTKVSVTMSGSYSSDNSYVLVVKDPAGVYDTPGSTDDYTRVHSKVVTGDHGAYYHYESAWDTQLSKEFRIDLYGEPPLPGKPINPDPEDEANDIALNETSVSWETGGNTDSYNLYFGSLSGFLSLVESGITGTSGVLRSSNFPNYNDYYYWRVDAVNENGVTTGDEWTLTTLSFSPPFPSGLTAGGDLDTAPTGTPTGENAVYTTRRLVAAANNKIWYEDI